MFGGAKPEKTETQVRLCKARLALQKNKRTIVVKQMRKEIADLLRTGKQEYARIRVEGVIRENLLMQAYEILGLYLELVAVRSQLIFKTKEIPRDMVEAISSIIYAAQRISDVPELAALRAVFASKYSKEYAAEASSDVTCTKWQVNANLIRCLLVEPPQPEEKLSMLSEIAQEHGVEWDLSAAARELLVPMPGTMPDGLVLPPSAVLAAGSQSGPSGGSHLQQQLQQARLQHPRPPPSGPSGGTPAGMPYMDPTRAAEAAAAAADHARAMADWAKEMAVQHAAAQYAGSANGNGAPPPGGPPPGSGGPPPGSGGPPPPGWLVTQSAGPSSSAGPPPGRTNEEIQRAYDAAIGPPTKGALSPSPYAAPPSVSPPPYTAPPSPPLDGSLPRVPAVLPTVPAADVDAMPQLPRPPRGFGPAEPEDEYDELSKRLDALKRS